MSGSICQRLVVIIALQCSFADFAYSREHEVRATVAVEKDRYSLSASADYRFSGHALSYKHQDAGVGIPLETLGKGLTTGWHYRRIQKIGHGSPRWNLEQRYYGQLEKPWRIGHSRLKVRVRQEVRTFEHRKTQHRNRLRVKWQPRSGSHRIKPYISNELFYAFDESALTHFRLDVGTRVSTSRHVDIRLYFKLVIDLDRGFGDRDEALGLHIVL